MIKNRLATLTAGVVTAVMLVGAGSGIASADTSRTSVQPTVAKASNIGIQAQAGFDRDHWWIKVSTAEIVSLGAGAVCRAAFGGVGWFVCPPIVAAIEAALAQNPNVGGFWAELYTNGQVRLGTW